MPDFIIAIWEMLDLSKPLDSALLCSCSSGGIHSPKIRCFQCSEHNQNGLRSTIFHLPHTKTTIHGENVSWSAQAGLTDPEAALQNHLAINTPPQEGPLFAYQHKKGHCPLTKPAFIKALATAARASGLEPRQGHGICIGSTLEYLLRGTPFDVMKAKRCWASDAFQVYLTKHAQILALYMQAIPELDTEFTRITMPPLRR